MWFEGSSLSIIGLRTSQSLPSFSALGHGYSAHGYAKYIQVLVLSGKNPPANSGDISDAGSIPGSGRSSEEGHGNPLQYSCLENPKDRGAWWAKFHMVRKSQI